MPRFPVNFRRKSTAAEDQNGPAEPSFRVLERPNSTNVKSFDGGVRLSRTAGGTPKSNLHDLSMEDNLFAGLNSNRYVISYASSLTAKHILCQSSLVVIRLPFAMVWRHGVGYNSGTGARAICGSAEVSLCRGPMSRWRKSLLVLVLCNLLIFR
jgi:hypothetical protein